jgi:phosphate transport system substrate-binding protein
MYNMKNILRILTIATAATSALLITGCSSPSDSDQDLSIIGSDTLLQVGLAWSEAYREVNKDVTVKVDGGGSGIGINALINDTAPIANSSRQIKDSEIASIKEKHGKEPVEHIVGYDGIAVYVNKENPIKSISLAQLKEIYAEGGTIDAWEKINPGITGAIDRSSRSSTSGTYSFFKEAVCGKGVEYKKGATTMSGSTAIVEFVGTTKTAIGYSGMGYKNDHVNWLAIYSDDASKAVEPSIEAVADGSYPIARPLYLYTVGEPEGVVKEYIDWLKSAAGQAVLAAEKFVPIPADKQTK